MRILYLADTDLDATSGVAHKILMQSGQWAARGHEVLLISLASLSRFSLDGKRLTPRRVTIERRGWKIFPHLLLTSWQLKRVLRQFDYDIVYMRYRLYAPFFKRALGPQPQIVEINTDDISEYRLSSRLLYLYNRMFRTLFLRSVDGLVCVSRELQQKFAWLDKPSVVIANGIDTSEYPFAPSTKTVKPSLVFIGSPNQKWHGVDKIFYLAEKLPEFDFHIIGIKDEGRSNLFYHGYLDVRNAMEVVQRLDVGIGTLSLHENRMHEASPLKTRQYFSHGLPVIYAYKDTDISAEEPFVLQLPNNRENIQTHLREIKEFVRSVYHDSTIRKQARDFAVAKLDVTVKEDARLHFFNTVLQKRITMTGEL